MNSVRFFVSFIAILHSAYPVHSQNNIETSPQTHYDFVRMLTGFGTHIGRSQELKASASELDLAQTLNDYKNNILTKGTLNSSLIKFIDEAASEQCSHDIAYTLWNLKSEWALKMLDAYGKPESGILEGNFKWLGNFHECTNIYAPPVQANKKTVGNFHGKYCSLQVGLPIGNKSVPLTLGICMPDTCNAIDIGLDIERLLNLIVPNPASLEMEAGFNITSIQCNPTTRKLTNAAIGMITLLSIFAFVALIGSSITAYEYFVTKPTRNDSICSDGALEQASSINSSLEKQSLTTHVYTHNKENTDALPAWVKNVNQYFNCFCLITNGKKLLDTSAEGQLPCLHGIRFLSMSWVIVCHNYAFCINVIGNILEMASVIDVWIFQIILNGFYSVDSFFELSGFLVAYLFFKEAPKTDGKIPWIYFYLHRFIRLTPVYMIVLGFNTVLANYLGSGPFWRAQDIEPVCQKYWWWNLLYINNFQSSQNQCFGWSWYLANDMQFFVISPLFLITLWRWPKVGWSLLGLFFSIAFAANFGITYYYDLFTGLMNNVMDMGKMAEIMAKYSEFFVKIYMKPYTRMSPYLIGVGLAYYLSYIKENNRGKNHWITLTCGWIISTAITLACLFGLFHRDPTLIGASFYNALNRSCFAFSLAWVIYVCLTNQADIVNSILSWKFFIPLSRLTYCAYLIHPIVITTYYSSLKTSLQFSHITMVTTYFGLQLITYILSFFVSLLFESPVIRLEKVIRSKFRP